MKQLQLFTILILVVFSLACKTNNDFIKRKYEETIALSEVSNPKILFVLQSMDTLKFSNKDVLLEIEKYLKVETKLEGYLVSKEMAIISQTLKVKHDDTTVFQNLSAVDSKTLSGNLDTWIARKLLLKGKVDVCRLRNTQRIVKLKYIYIKDKLNGEQGTFYTENYEMIFSTVIRLGE